MGSDAWTLLGFNPYHLVVAKAREEQTMAEDRKFYRQSAIRSLSRVSKELDLLAKDVYGIEDQLDWSGTADLIAQLETVTDSMQTLIDDVDVAIDRLVKEVDND